MAETLIKISLIICAAVCGYLLGSLNFALIISKILYHDDIRKHGSGNAGTTNMLRTYGKKAAALTLLGDLLKGVLAAVIFGIILKAAGFTYIKGATTAGFAAILGHNWPVYFNFKGGKGVLTSFAVLLAVLPIQALICLGIFIIVVVITKYISLGSILAAGAFPVISVVGAISFPPEDKTDIFYMLTFAAIVSFMIIIRHRSNIKRLVQGKENKLSFNKKA